MVALGAKLTPSPASASAGGEKAGARMCGREGGRAARLPNPKRRDRVGRPDTALETALVKKRGSLRDGSSLS